MYEIVAILCVTSVYDCGGTGSRVKQVKFLETICISLLITSRHHLNSKSSTKVRKRKKKRQTKTSQQCQNRSVRNQNNNKSKSKTTQSQPGWHHQILINNGQVFMDLSKLSPTTNLICSMRNVLGTSQKTIFVKMALESHVKMREIIIELHSKGGMVAWWHG